MCTTHVTKKLLFQDKKKVYIGPTRYMCCQKSKKDDEMSTFLKQIKWNARTIAGDCFFYHLASTHKVCVRWIFYQLDTLTV